MKMTGRVIMLGIEEKQSAKGNKYKVGLFQQGTETVNAMVKLENIPQDIKQYEPCIVDFDYNTKYQKLDVIGLKKA